MTERVLLKNTANPDSHRIDAYLAAGGYQGLTKALREFSPEEIIQLVTDSNLRGRGGAGFSTGLKWSFVPKETARPKYLCCNADEGEPGTFKDREIIEKDPHMLIEGMAIAAYAIGVETAYIYVRGEFDFGARRIEEAIKEAYRERYLGDNILASGFNLDIHVFRGAGAYICGEETALIESLEGKRGQPRLKPPFPAIVGLYGCPTVINNVETLACVPHILLRGADWFKGIGPEDSPGTKLFCLSGHVRNPGVYELPMGIALRHLVEKHGGGTRSGKKIKAVIPGGASAPMLPESGLDIDMDFASLASAGTMLGSGGVIVMDETTCIVRVAKRTMGFFHHESCGKCTPCRDGLYWAAKLLKRLEAGKGKKGDVEELESLCDNIFGKTFCPLGDGAALALRGAIKHFRDEFVYHVEKGKCMVS